MQHWIERSPQAKGRLYHKSHFFNLSNSLEVVWMFPESYSSSSCLLIFLTFFVYLSFCPRESLRVHICSSQFIEIGWFPSKSCVLSCCLSVFQYFCPNLSLMIHLSLYSFKVLNALGPLCLWQCFYNGEGTQVNFKAIRQSFIL